MKFIMFNDKKVDTNLFLQLQDLASVLTQQSDIEFSFQYGHLIDEQQKKITASHFWDNRKALEQICGYKTDIYLRALGTKKYTIKRAVLQYKEILSETHLKRFGIQLFTLLEDLRIEERIKKEKPGTVKLFQIRREVLKKYFKSQLSTNIIKSYPLDELFCLIYLTVEATNVFTDYDEANDEQKNVLEQIKPFIYEYYDVTSTNQVVALCEKIVFLVTPLYKKDCYNEYFVLPFMDYDAFQKDNSFDDLLRKDGLVNDDADATDLEEKETLEEQYSTWHRETDVKDDNETFLHFELESGTRTKILGDTVREGDEGDQALASVQGSANKSKEKDYSKLEALNEKKQLTPIVEKVYRYGEENRAAVQINKKTITPTIEERNSYRQLVQEIDGYRRKLENTIKKTLEHKKTSPRKDLIYGRLSKKLFPLVLEQNPKVFYKKTSPSTEIDAVFTLLVDCSASMHNKMDETKKGIILFHEVLKKLNIPHSIIGFWEDANNVKEGYQPNYFHRVVHYSSSLTSHGAEILQLEAEEDNRDGFSIRVITEDLLKRAEKHKFLLVFSDGEPAADNYAQNGIVDTHEAVLLARKQKIEVIGLYLADGEIMEHDEQTMRNIYGKEHLLIPHIEQLPERFSPLLKRLILKSV